MRGERIEIGLSVDREAEPVRGSCAGATRVAGAAALLAAATLLGALTGTAAAAGDGADGSSSNPVISASGRYVAYTTRADNLGGPIDTGVVNIYRYDKKTRKTRLVSRRSKSQGGAGADGSSFSLAISASGRYVAYTTDAANLGGPAADVHNVYRYDFKRKKTRLVSRRSKSQGGAGGDNDSFGPAISASGRHVAYTTDAGNLGGPVAAVVNVYRYDVKTKRTRLVSRRSRSQGGAGGDNDSFGPAISASGRHVAYTTDAGNLGGQAENVDNICRYDFKRKRTRLVSRRSKAQGGAGADSGSFSPAISASGGHVAYSTAADNLGGPAEDVQNIYRYDFERKRTRLTSRRSR